ncbi:hypothetical protein AB0L40_17080 [Patulibacter sp. NPDC049589]|uniref:hypothetical protein n=1 Tax=Patulibacter sp. NPDC049589 TaxID=3154731 RepID=UPI00342F7FB5
MSFASSLTSNLRRVPARQEHAPGAGRRAIVAHVDRWFAAPRPATEGRAVLVVLDVDLDDALPAGETEEAARRDRLGRTVERALSAHVRAGDAVARIDVGRFAVLRGGLSGTLSVGTEAREIARGVEEALVDRPEGFGARVTVGGSTLVDGAARGGQAALGAVTAAMLQGKLLSDDRVVVVVAPGG